MQTIPPPPIVPPPPVVDVPPPPSPAEGAPRVFDEAGLRAEYGPPDFVRKETGSELWRYDGAHCALFLFLDREEGALMLRYMESLPRGASDPADPNCVDSIKARAGAPSP